MISLVFLHRQAGEKAHGKRSTTTWQPSLAIIALSSVINRPTAYPQQLRHVREFPRIA